MRLKDKVCVVPGGASGIGEATCHAFDQEGPRVAILDINLERSVRVASTLNNSFAIRCDVSDSKAVDEAFKQVITRWSGVDVLVNNAGIVGKDGYSRAQATGEAQFEEQKMGKVLTPLRVTVNLTDAQWEQMIAVHLHGTFYCTRAALRSMDRQRSGAIVNMSSIDGIDGGQGNPQYAAAKVGILGSTRSLAKEAIFQGIRVNVIAPGFIETPLRATIRPAIQKTQMAGTPIGRPGTSDEVAATAVFLACDESSYFAGQTLSPSGGYITH